KPLAAPGDRHAGDRVCRTHRRDHCTSPPSKSMDAGVGVVRSALTQTPCRVAPSSIVVHARNAPNRDRARSIVVVGDLGPRRAPAILSLGGGASAPKGNIARAIPELRLGCRPAAPAPAA